MPRIPGIPTGPRSFATRMRSQSTRPTDPVCRARSRWSSHVARPSGSASRCRRRQPETELPRFHRGSPPTRPANTIGRKRTASWRPAALEIRRSSLWFHAVRVARDACIAARRRGRWVGRKHSGEAVPRRAGAGAYLFDKVLRDCVIREHLPVRILAQVEVIVLPADEHDCLAVLARALSASWVRPTVRDPAGLLDNVSVGKRVARRRLTFGILADTVNRHAAGLPDVSP